MDFLLEKARRVFGEEDWSTWAWSVRDDGTATGGVRSYRAAAATVRNGCSATATRRPFRASPCSDRT